MLDMAPVEAVLEALKMSRQRLTENRCCSIFLHSIWPIFWHTFLPFSVEIFSPLTYIVAFYLAHGLAFYTWHMF